MRPATCAGFDCVMFNSLNQSPCEVTSKLIDFGLELRGHGLAIDPWVVYSNGCDPLYMQQFLSPGVPNGTAVPGWAYLTIADDTFDLNTAHRLARIHPAENKIPAIVPRPLSSIPAPATATPTLSSAPSQSTPSTPIISQTQSGQGVSKKDLVGIVAGSVNGGGIVLISLAVFLLQCPAHEAARSTHLTCLGRRGRNLAILLSTPSSFRPLLRYVGATRRLQNTFGNVTPKGAAQRNGPSSNRPAQRRSANT
ncbi:hypothetical protein BD311DRAFT_347777 [Dichomitus squalens]|uniref:Uncharacterized protein n=1 Tax=Dichomitus squalens TaxID=114155 RepID=A0A4Q9N2S8_9APHY|nr:hypothetical protein BD311DRAFT_347777 [Dichomitus squalens]